MRPFLGLLLSSRSGKLGRSLLVLIVFGFASQLAAQPIVLDNNVPIVFKNAGGAQDGTIIKRFAGNALRFQFAGAVAIFDALENHPFQVRSPSHGTIFSVDPDSHAFFRNSGNFGIGRSPSNNVKLDIQASGIGAGVRFLRTDAKDARIQVGDPTRTWSIAVGWATGGDFSIIEELVSGNRLYIKQGGNVGLGTSNPQARLDVQGDTRVNGTVTAREVRVTAQGWPDYVFADGYDLPSLAELEAAIEREGHLPGIPSAAEAESEGVAVGDLQAKLLEKVEELTLYVIELKKENERLEARLDGMAGRDGAGS